MEISRHMVRWTIANWPNRSVLFLLVHVSPPLRWKRYNVSKLTFPCQKLRKQVQISMPSQKVFTARHALHIRPTLVDQKRQNSSKCQKRCCGVLWFSLQPNKLFCLFFAINAETTTTSKTVQLKFNSNSHEFSLFLKFPHEVKSDENYLIRVSPLLNSKLSCRPYANTTFLCFALCCGVKVGEYLRRIVRLVNLFLS